MRVLRVRGRSGLIWTRRDPEIERVPERGSIMAGSRERAVGIARAGEMLEELPPGTAVVDAPMRPLCWLADRTVRRPIDGP